MCLLSDAQNQILTSNNDVFLRLEKVNHTVDMYYRVDGKKWNKIESSLEVSSLNHNTLGGFLSLRIGLCSVGKGKVLFKKFEYKHIE